MNVPIGTILPYGGEITGEGAQHLRDQGWLPCDGEEYTVDEYLELHQVIGFYFGGNLTTKFRVPDMQGRFIRGVDHKAGRDPDAKYRTASGKEEHGNDGNAVGSVQEDEFKKHSHELKGVVLGTGRKTRYAGGEHGSWAEKTGETGGQETRPKNIYVNFIIKAKDVPVVLADPK